MPYEYYAENHDWDLTLRASWNLCMSGQAVTEKKELEFSCFTGSMLLSFCAIESILASIAFCISRDAGYSDFNYTDYKDLSRFNEKLGLVCNALNIKVDRSKGLFQKIEQMRLWRNTLVHSSPYSIELTEITETKDSKKLHKKLATKQYTKTVKTSEAKIFYDTAYQFVELLKKESGLDPRAMCQYRVL